MKKHLLRRLRILSGAEKLVFLCYTMERGYEGTYQCRGRKEEISFTLDHNSRQFLGLNGLPANADQSAVAKNLFHFLGLGDTRHTLLYRERRNNTFYILVASFTRQINIKQNALCKQLFYYHIGYLEEEKLANQNDFLTESIKSLVKISKVMLETMDFEVLLTEINSAVKKLLGAGGAGLLLYDETKKQLILQKPAFGIEDEKIIAAYRVPIEGEGNAVKVFRNQKPYFSNNAQQDPAILKNMAELFNVTNTLSVPVLIGNRCIGVFHVINKDGGFNSEDVNLIRLFISQIAVVIENTRLFNRIRAQEEKMRRLYEYEKETCVKFKNLMDFHQMLTMNLLNGNGFKGITEGLSHYMELPVLFFDRLNWNKHIACLIPEGHHDSRKEMEWLAESCESHSKEVMEHAMVPYRNTYHGPQGEEIPIVVSAIRVDKEMLGMLVVREKKSKLNQFEMLAVERAVYMYALELMKEKMVFEVEQDLKGEFFGALFNWDDTQDESEIVRRAKYFGYELNFPQSVAVLEIVQAELSGNDGLDDEQHIFNLKRRLLRLVNDLIKTNHFHGLASISAKGVNLLISAPKGTGKNLLPAARRFVTALQKSITAGMNITINVGIGNMAQQLEEIRSSYHQALGVIDFLNKIGDKGRAMHFSELGIYKLLLNNPEGKQLEQFAYDQLEALIKHDSQHRTSFLLTLERYFDNDGNLRASADELFIHINTMRYRMDSIQDKFGIDLSSPEKKFNIHFAIKVLSFTNPALFKKVKMAKGTGKAV